MSTPFMQLYVADYLGDTRHLSTEQHGAYLLVLMAMWRAGGFVPADDATLARIAGLTLTRWNRIKGFVMAFLTIEEGHVTQKRLRAELKKAEEKSLKRAEAGRSGGHAKALKDNEPALAIASVLPKHSLEPEPEPERKERKNISAVASPTPPIAASPEFIRLPTNRFETEGEEVPITEQFVEDFQKLYPAVDVRAELRKMRGWLISKPETRKTRKGMTRFVNAWLARQQDRVPRETAYGDRNGRKQSPQQSFGTSIREAVRERGGGSLFDSGNPEIIDITPARNSESADDEEGLLGWSAHAA